MLNVIDTLCDDHRAYKMNNFLVISASFRVSHVFQIPLFPRCVSCFQLDSHLWLIDAALFDVKFRESDSRSDVRVNHLADKRWPQAMG